MSYCSGKEVENMASLVPYNYGNRGIFDVGFGDVLNSFLGDDWPARTLTRTSFKVDVEETDRAYVVSADLPGVKKDEIDVDMADGRLTISVAHSEATSDESKNYLHRERSYSSMTRSVCLPDIDATRIEAKLDEGVLTVNVPKVPEADRSTKIEVK